jgi:predicted lipoprotein with Yx(FWY)xxD motif
MGIAAATTMAAVAFAQMAPTKTGNSDKGKVLTNDAGMTLYVFDKDSTGKSACNGPCVGNWPPLMATASSMPMGDYTIITRDDGRSMLGKTIRSRATSPAMVSSMAPGTLLNRSLI